MISDSTKVPTLQGSPCDAYTKLESNFAAVLEMFKRVRRENIFTPSFLSLVLNSFHISCYSRSKDSERISLTNVMD